MRKIFALLIITISSLILLTAMNQGLINRVKQDRYFEHLSPVNAGPKSLYQQIFIRSDRWGYGDLYGICYLPQYRLKIAPFGVYNNQPDNKPTNRILYIIGDSFTADKTFNKAFTGFDNVIFLDRRFPFGPISIDATKQNYLILEFSELNISAYSSKNSPEILSRATAPQAYEPVSLISRLGHILFNKELNRNIELLLFDDKIFTPFKELKAWANYHFLGRLPKEVTVSTDKSRLLLNTTVDVSSSQSAFRPWSDAAVNGLTQDLAADQQRYLSMGFKKVFLSLIPNAVSVYDSKRSTYNHLLERVETKTSLPVISVYNIFKADKRNLYSRSDAHWNPLGFEIWVNEANRVLKSSLN